MANVDPPGLENGARRGDRSRYKVILKEDPYAYQRQFLDLPISYVSS